MSENVTPVTTESNKNVVTQLRTLIQDYGGSTETLNKIVALGVECPEDIASLTAEELADAGLQLVKARKLLASLKKPEAPSEAKAPTATRAATVVSMDAVLPSVPSDESWLSGLQTGGVLKVGEHTYIAAIRAAMASKVGLYGVLDKLVKLLENHAEALDEPCGQNYYTLLAEVTRRDYGELFSAIPGVNGSFATAARRKAFLDRLNTIFWPAVREAHSALNAWYDSARASFNDPSVLLGAISGQNFGGFGISIPEFDPIIAASDSLKDQINRVFSGTMVPVSMALAYDAKKIIDTLNDASLPSQIGAGNRDQMMKMLELNVNSSYAMLEQRIVRYVLSYIKFSEVATGNEIQYLSALWQLGNSISWDVIGYGSGSTASFGGSNKL